MDPPSDIFLDAFESLNVLDKSESPDHITDPRQLQKIIRSLRTDIRQKDAARTSNKAKNAKADRTDVKGQREIEERESTTASLETAAQPTAKAKEPARRKAHERLQREGKGTLEALREIKQLKRAAKMIGDSEKDDKGNVEDEKDDVEEEHGVERALKIHEMDTDIPESVPVQKTSLVRSVGRGKRRSENLEDGVIGNDGFVKRFRAESYE
ncbi:hypothetical protein BKA65DRAFT_533695 [Rhexocercosporidium sp. MPI-PUGE-AT-0058]|nr:hypothetical protein BKA65DRAFT_533695 [Rhexocercosporidium sp. MPI-PUGE-AT-0058]